MRFQFYIPLFILGFSPGVLSAQLPPPCSGSNFPGTNSCADACVICDFAPISGSTTGYTPSDISSFCGQVSNDQWYGFLAGDTTVTFTITPSNCEDGNGIQAALYTDCSLPPIYCDPGDINHGNEPISFQVATIPGHAYFLMIDGYQGDYCDFTINVSPSNALQAPEVGDVQDIIGPSTICVQEPHVFSLSEPVDGASVYVWTTSPPCLINGASGPYTAIGNDNLSVEITLPFSAGGVNVCVYPDNSCDAGTPKCTTFPVTPLIPPTILSEMFVCQSDLPTLLPWGELASGPGQYFTIYPSSVGCTQDSMVVQTVSVLPDVFMNYGLKLFCENECFSSDGQDFCLPGSYQVTYAAVNGCDSTITWMQVGYAAPGRGIIYHDQNADGIRQVHEAALSGIQVQTSAGETDTSNVFGLYSLVTISQGDTIWPIGLPAGFTVEPAYYIFDPTMPTCYNFALTGPGGACSGLVYWDYNDNGIKDNSEPPAVNIPVFSSGGALALSGSQGEFDIAVSNPGDTIRPVVQGLQSNPDFRLYSSGVTSGYWFGLMPPANKHDLAVGINNSGPFRPGFNQNLTATIVNHLSFVQNVELELVIPGFLDIQGYSILPDLILGDTLIWNLGTFGPGQMTFINIQVSTPVSTPLGADVHIKAWVQPEQNDLFVGNNFYSLHRTVVGSYDPNEKVANPPYILAENADLREPIEYTIRFQNTGNYPADFVVLEDTLSPDFDLSSFRFVASSHTCSWEIEPGRVLVVRFDNINLPDSLSDEPGSHGFFCFALRPKAGFDLGYSLQNTADIFFDFNDPIRTNTATSQVVYFIPDGPLPTAGTGLGVRPNPTSWHLYVDWSEPAEAGSYLVLYNLNGLPVLQQDVAPEDTLAELDVSTLPPALYVLAYVTPNGIEHKQVLVVRSGPVRRFK